MKSQLNKEQLYKCCHIVVTKAGTINCVNRNCKDCVFFAGYTGEEAKNHTQLFRVLNTP